MRRGQRGAALVVTKNDSPQNILPIVLRPKCRDVVPIDVPGVTGGTLVTSINIMAPKRVCETCRFFDSEEPQFCNNPFTPVYRMTHNSSKGESWFDSWGCTDWETTIVQVVKRVVKSNLKLQ